ncbi:hypothetical protein [uncultured Flavobacterium sp.]|uniref:hypothetical protein n=1 Tax=uncultured Flavobacterium sp. TaxID=165435 RepID=UPI00308215D8
MSEENKKIANEENTLEEQKRIEQEWNEFRTAVYETKSKSQDDFEKYINLIGSGGLGLTIAFFDKIVQINIAIYLILIVIGWFLLAFTLLINLISHYKSIQYSDRTISEINDKEYDEILTNVGKRNKTINILNGISLFSLISGVSLIILFVILNIYNMSDNQKPTPNQQPKPSTQEKGRTTPSPPRNTPAPANPQKK